MKIQNRYPLTAFVVVIWFIILTALGIRTCDRPIPTTEHGGAR